MFPSFDEFMEERAAESARTYEVRWLKKLYKEVYSEGAFTADKRSAGDEFSFHWFNENYPLPIKLYASRLKNIAPADILRTNGITRRAFWLEYWDLKSGHPRGAHMGLIFPVVAMQHFIMHNMVGLEPVVGVTRVVRIGRSPDRSIIVEPADAFITALAKALSGEK